jgi:hypothetical protein
MNTITTRVEGPLQRIIHLDRDTAAVAKLFNLWPLPLFECLEIPNCYGLPFGATDFNMTAFKFQFPDMDYETACDTGDALAGLVAAGAARLAQSGVSGTLIPAVYLREKSPTIFETGFAVFCDELTENASWLLCSAFIEAMPTEIAGVTIPPMPPFVGTFERRDYSQLGDLFLETAILDGELLLVSSEMPEGDDLVWAALTEPGTEVRVPHVPCMPMQAQMPVGELLVRAGYAEA